MLAERTSSPNPLTERFNRGPEYLRIVLCRIPPERLEDLLLNERHWHERRQPHEQRSDEVVASTLGTGNKDELCIVATPRLKYAFILNIWSSNVRSPE